MIDDGINAVASFLKSRNSGAAKTVAAASSAVDAVRVGCDGLGGSDGWGGGGGTLRLARWAWNV